MSVYKFSAQNAAGLEMEFDHFKGKVLLIANTASQCGLTPQYGELQKLYDRYHEQGLEILAFPCNQFGGQEPGTNEEAASFCVRNYGVSFPVFAKVDVNGEEAHPLFNYLKQALPGENPGGEISWNFTKFLIDREGRPVSRFEPKQSPETMAAEIEDLLGS